MRRSLRLAEKRVAPEDGGHGIYPVSSLSELPDELDIGYLIYNTYSLVHSLSTIVHFALSHTLLCSSILHLIPFLARAPFAEKAG